MPEVWDNIAYVEQVKNKDLRMKIVNTIYNSGEGHIPSAFSIVEILKVLYADFLKVDPDDADGETRDIFILSKGHGCAALYVVLEKHGFISQSDLDNKGTEQSILGGHPDASKINGVEFSTGSLGHGLPLGIGVALGLKILRRTNKVIVLVGDQECNEGTVWESALVASNLKLDNLTVIVDNNKSAEKVLPVPNMKSKWQSFGWEVQEVDGHSEDQLKDSFRGTVKSKPRVIIADTVKGKGVSFMEDNGAWHSKVPNKEEYEKIVDELK